MFGKLKEHKKKIALGLAVLGAVAAYLTGDCDAACVVKTVAGLAGGLSL